MSDSKKRKMSDASTVEQVEQTVDGSWKDEGAGFSLISSDNVQFYIAKYHIHSASKVFGDMIQIGNEDTTVPLSDPSLETSHIIRLFLHCVVHGPPTKLLESRAKEAYDDIVLLYRFAEKYAATRIQGLIKAFLHNSLLDGYIDVITLLVIASQLQMDDLAALCIRRDAYNFYPMTRSQPAISAPSVDAAALKKKENIALKSLHINLIKRLSPEMVYALSRYDIDPKEGQAEKQARFTAALQEARADI